MQTFRNDDASDIVLAMADKIIANKAYLSEIDGKIGDGDHGVNMAKGFGMAAERINAATTSFSGALTILGDVLMGEIGGSMGPLYGSMFTDFADAIAERETIDGPAFGMMLHKGLEGVQSIGSAKRGDKTMLDALIPAVEAFDAATADAQPFSGALEAMAAAADRGRDSTLDLVAKVGRASRLGERSRGVLDAGATSCAMILGVLAEGARQHLV